MTAIIVPTVLLYLVGAAIAAACGIEGAWEAGGLALAACLLAALGGLLVNWIWHAPSQLLGTVVIGWLVRMGLPLATVLIVVEVLPRTYRDRLTGGGFIVFMLVFYLAALAIETAMFVRSSAAAGRGVSS